MDNLFSFKFLNAQQVKLNNFEKTSILLLSHNLYSNLLSDDFWYSDFGGKQPYFKGFDCEYDF